MSPGSAPKNQVFTCCGYEISPRIPDDSPIVNAIMKLQKRIGYYTCLDKTLIYGRISDDVLHVTKVEFTSMNGSTDVIHSESIKKICAEVPNLAYAG
jgi:hypothetical protein